FAWVISLCRFGYRGWGPQLRVRSACGGFVLRVDSGLGLRASCPRGRKDQPERRPPSSLKLVAGLARTKTRPESAGLPYAPITPIVHVGRRVVPKATGRPRWSLGLLS